MSELSHSSDSNGSDRRTFLKLGLTAAGAGLIPGVTLVNVQAAIKDGEPASSKNRWGLLIDTNKCADGCTACVDACNKEFNIQPSKKPSQTVQFIRKVKLRHKLTQKEVSMPVMCQHCEHPPCVDVCPTGASMKRADGIVKVDMHRCIGCRYCMMACPYKARSFIHEDTFNQKSYAPRGKGCVDSCNLCLHRIDENRDNPRNPACVEACNADGHKAMVFGDLNDANSSIRQDLKKYQSRELRSDLGLNTGVRYRGI